MLKKKKIKAKILSFFFSHVFNKAGLFFYFKNIFEKI